ncbi:MAG: RDD family protein [Bryobacteraceae bacterium]
MICQRCGHASAATSAFCTNCGEPQQLQAAVAAGASGAQPVSRPIHESVRFAPAASVARSVDATRYAPFLGRFVAFLLDEFLAGALAAVTYFIMAAIAAASGASSFHRGYGGGYRMGAGLGASFFLLLLGGLLAFAVYVYYFVKQETGPKQATIGKTLLGLKVMNASGGTISVGQSLGRLIVKSTISGLFFALGFLMAAFTERKQALHDFIAGTVVVQR